MPLYPLVLIHCGYEGPRVQAAPTRTGREEIRARFLAVAPISGIGDCFGRVCLFRRLVRRLGQFCTLVSSGRTRGRNPLACWFGDSATPRSRDLRLSVLSGDCWNRCLSPSKRLNLYTVNLEVDDSLDERFRPVVRSFELLGNRVSRQWSETPHFWYNSYSLLGSVRVHQAIKRSRTHRFCAFYPVLLFVIHAGMHGSADDQVLHE